MLDQTIKIGFLGGGNMARSMIAGLVASHHPASHLFVCDKHEKKRKALNQAYNVHALASAEQLVQKVDVLILAVKPQAMLATLETISQQLLQQKPLILSVAAGIPLHSYENALSSNLAIVRLMPNTPSQVGAGITGILANSSTSSKECEIAEKIATSFGTAVWLENDQAIEVLTAISGCGPAYFFLFTELLTECGVKQGLDQETSAQLATQTLVGAATMASKTRDDLRTLRRHVAAKGGSTEQAVQVLQDGNLQLLLDNAVEAALQRCAELAKSL